MESVFLLYLTCVFVGVGSVLLSPTVQFDGHHPAGWVWRGRGLSAVPLTTLYCTASPHCTFLAWIVSRSPSASLCRVGRNQHSTHRGTVPSNRRYETNYDWIFLNPHPVTWTPVLLLLVHCQPINQPHSKTLFFPKPQNFKCTNLATVAINYQSSWYHVSFWLQTWL